MNSTANFSKTPRWVFRAIEDGQITHDQFDLLVYAHYKMDWDTRIVSAYSAENLCRFLQLDATKANLKRFQRAERELQRLGVIWDDYRRHDKRPYRLGLPAETIETIESLFISSIVAESVPENVADRADAKNVESDTWSPSPVADVVECVAEGGRAMSFNNQYSQNQEKESPLPPQGVSTPPALFQREHSNAVGLIKPTTRARKALTPSQCALLDDAVLGYVEFTNWLYDFVPDVENTTKLLREFSPEELFYIQVRKFPLDGSRVVTKRMAYFFARGAKPLIEAARLGGTSRSVPPYIKSGLLASEWKEFPQRWQIMRDRWNKANLDVNSKTAPDEVANAS